MTDSHQLRHRLLELHRRLRECGEYEISAEGQRIRDEILSIERLLENDDRRK